MANRQIFWGNILMAVCCVFYLSWWVLAFKPNAPIRGMKSGWLLIPAVIAGIAAVISAIQGVMGVAGKPLLFPNYAIIPCGVVIYIALLLVTQSIFDRPVTSELLLIVGWTMLALAMINSLYGLRLYSGATAIAFIVITAAACIVSLICYVLYFKLANAPSFYDGMVPLILVLLLSVGMDLPLLRA
jgi:hypothetical protein